MNKAQCYFHFLFEFPNRYRGPVCDISFAHINSPLLGAIDESGSLFIYHVDQTAKQTSIQYNILLQVQRKDTIPSTYHRIVWSPHIHLSKDGETEEIVSGQFLNIF